MMAYGLGRNIALLQTYLFIQPPPPPISKRIKRTKKSLIIITVRSVH